MSSPTTFRYWIDLKLAVMRLRWLMLAVILFDMGITLLGQPSSFWRDPSTVHEGNELYHFIMSQGLVVLFVIDLIYLVGCFLLVTYLPVRFALAILFAMIFGHFFGGSSWLCFRFKLGAAGMIVYGMVLSWVVVEILMRSRMAESLKEREFDDHTGV